MKRIQFVVTILTLVFAATLPAGEIQREGAMEKMPLLPASGAKTWAPAESTIEPSAARAKIGDTSWRWHVSVDHFAGEAKYPIGWPRIGHGIPAGALRDWSGWDYLRMWVYTETSRDALPRDVAGLGLHTPDRAGAYNRMLAELKKGQWVEIRIPLTEIPRHHDVRHLQFHISESHYRHGDELDFFLNDIALLRYAAPTLVSLAPENTVMFSDAQRLPVVFQLAGIKPGKQVEVACELRRDGRTIVRIAAQAGRGVQRVVLDRGRETLPAGEYELRATIAGDSRPATARVRVVESPWN